MATLALIQAAVAAQPAVPPAIIAIQTALAADKALCATFWQTDLPWP